MGQSNSVQEATEDQMDTSSPELEKLKSQSEAQNKEIENITNKRNENAKELETLQGQNQDCTQSIKSTIVEQLEELKLRLQAQTQELQTMKEENESQKQEIAGIKAETEEKLQVLEAVVAQHKDAENIQAAAFVWKLERFGQLIKTAKKGKHKTINSQPFYETRNGYRMKVRIHPNGIESGKGTHLSAYIVLMKGDYDAILPWPFAKNVTLSIVDQQDNISERDNIKALFKGEDEKCFEKPQSEENAPFGDEKLVTQDDLQGRKYIVDDTLFLIVNVEEP